MTRTIPQAAAPPAAPPPERTATPAERAQEAARIVGCKCGARPGASCDGHGNFHLGRFATARCHGRLSAAEMTAVLAAVPGGVFTALTIVTLPAGGAR